MKRFLVLTVLLCSFRASADDGLDQLKKSFSGLAQTATKEFDRAAGMKVATQALGSEITKDQCMALANKIKANYKIDPFNFVYASGSAQNYMCGGQWGWQKNRLLKVTGTSNLGQKYAYVIQLEGSDRLGYRDEITN
jgi:hypothetical protein